MRFQDLEGVENSKGPDNKVVRERQEHNLMVRIMDENTTVRGLLNLSAFFTSDETVNHS